MGNLDTSIIKRCETSKAMGPIAVMTLRTLSCRCQLSPHTSFKAFQEAKNALRNMHGQKDIISTISDVSSHQLVWVKCEENSRNLQHCHYCNSSFATKNELEIHMSKSHPDTYHVKCDAVVGVQDEPFVHSDACLDTVGSGSEWLHDAAVSAVGSGRVLKKDVKVTRHCRKNFQHSVKKNFLCKVCERTFTRQYDLKRHSDCHPPPRTDKMEEREFVIDTDTVDLWAQSEWDEETKMDYKMMLDEDFVKKGRRKRARSASFHCIECGKNFSLKDSYFRHMRIHTGEKPFTCHICGKQFRDSGGLARHLKDVHARIKKFSCDLCGRSFASKATTEDHRRIHTGERPYVCDSCGKAFKSKASLYIHSKIHTNSFPHNCSYCEKHFRRRQELLAHVTTHTGEKPHACDTCGRCFRVRGELLRHKLIHSEDKPYACTVCGLNFRQKRYLKNHEKTRHARLELST